MEHREIFEAYSRSDLIMDDAVKDRSKDAPEDDLEEFHGRSISRDGSGLARIVLYQGMSSVVPTGAVQTGEMGNSSRRQWGM